MYEGYLWTPKGRIYFFYKYLKSGKAEVLQMTTEELYGPYKEMVRKYEHF